MPDWKPLSLLVPLILTALAAVPSPAATQGTVEELALEAEDGGTLAATLYLPASSRKSPAVILIHQEGSDHTQWAPYVPPLVARGYVVLTYDVQTATELETIIPYLRDHPAVDELRIGVIGAGHGANLAIAANHQYGLAGVALSPSTAEARQLAGLEDGDDFDLKSLFYIATAGDGQGQAAHWAQELHDRTAEPRRLLILEDSAAHGVGIFEDSRITFERVLRWLKERV